MKPWILTEQCSTGHFSGVLYTNKQRKWHSVPFINETPTETEIDIIKQQLLNWNNLNDFDKRMFKLFRNTLKYGDQVFIRDPETFELYWVEMGKVTKVIVNESEGKKPEQYVIKDINPNFEIHCYSKHIQRSSNKGDLYKNRGYIQPVTCMTAVAVLLHKVVLTKH